MKEIGSSHWWYIALKSYLRFLHEGLMIHRRYTLGLDKMPQPGERYFIVANHQNTANDPLNIIFTFPVRYHICALARANVFQVHPWITRFLRWIGLMPAFRFGWEGGEGLEENFQSFDEVASRVNDGYPVIVFPEAGHTQGHYLDRFTTGAVRMAFHTARQNGWTKDVKIVPTAHHYADYFGLRTDFVWMISDPVSLKPYYDAYQQHPNATMRNITHQLRERIQGMMLDEGSDDYEAKDFLRTSALNPATMRKMPLTERLECDKLFCRQLQEHLRQAEIIRLAAELQAKEQAIGTDDATMERRPSWAVTLSWIVLLAVLLPLWIVCLWPHAVCYVLPPRFIREDKMFTNSYRYILSALLLYPLFALLTLLTLGLAWGWWWQTTVWILLWIPTGQLAWWYWKQLRQTYRRMRYHLASDRLLHEAKDIRNKIKLILNEHE